ncbi:serine hydrolase [Phnomibacter ginsenosidimutans]|uniref:Serine hydrolase n=1 Tax=Phnomibacter ginsenosidimutans TaxID=2676868 RepID=A0A6I6G4H3_9BACT|nr:serine hydrolase [Phnomibacter ginsenosidimutans]QGW27516.1 serine hydrolase [Phnomibacter ginsenosidimutans]
MMKQIIAPFFLVCITIVANAQQRDHRLAGLDSMINSILTEWNVPGVSIAVVEKNKVLFTGGFGYRDYENKKPVTGNTLFAIGSCTKAFTASLIGNLVKDFSLDLDAPISSYYPALKFYNSELTSNVTVRDLLCHRTGLPRHDYAWYSGAMGNRDSMVRLIKYLEPSAPLRQTFQYNNLNYVALARLLEITYQKSWEQLIEEKLFAPLSMKSSSTGQMSNASDYSIGYINKNGHLQELDFLPSALSGIAPAGGIASSANDMAKWLLMWTNQGAFDGKEIITAEFYKQAISSQMIASANLPSKLMSDYYFFNYGLGWYTVNYRGHYGVGHGGNINGFSSFVSFLPIDSIGIFISVNQHNSEVPRILHNIIADRMIGASYRDWNSIMKMQTRTLPLNAGNTVKATKPSHSFTDFAGTYTNNAYGRIVIKDSKDGLTGTFNRWNLKIKHLQYNYFTFFIDEQAFDGSEAMNGQFTIGADGAIASLQMPFESSVKDIEFKRQVSTSQIIKVDLTDYCGDYDFNGSVATIYLTSNSILKAKVPGQPEFELQPIGQDEFAVKGAKGVKIKFERDDKGNIPACVFVQPNGSLSVKRIGNTKVGTSGNSSNEDKSASVGKNDFTKYVGEYNMGGQQVKVYLKQEILMAKIPGQPDYTLIPAGKDAFAIKGVKGYGVLFETDKNDNVIGFTLQQPNGNIKAEKK